MDYTVISLFPVAKDTQHIVEQLIDNGFSEENINVSKYTIEGEIAEHLPEEEQPKNFWDFLFGDSEWRTAYQQAALENNTITVYTDNLHTARKAKNLMDELGALDIRKYKENLITNDESDENIRIIPKSRHNVYPMNNTKVHKARKPFVRTFY